MKLLIAVLALLAISDAAHARVSGPGNYQIVFFTLGITSSLPVIQSQSRRSPVNEVAHQLDRNSRDCERSTIACLYLLEQEGI